MTIGCIGADHTRASVAQRETLMVSGERLDALLDALVAVPAVAEAAVLSTCNRTEVYLAASDIEAAFGEASRCLAVVTGTSVDEVTALTTRRSGGDAACHLCAVAAGLRSLVVGETQILTQVREAFEHAAARGAAGPELSLLGRSAVRCGKRARATTTIGAVDTSVSGVVVELAARHFGGLGDRTALLIGAGRINEVGADLLRSAGIGSLVVVSRSRETAERLAAACDGQAGSMDDLPALLATADLGIAATRAPEPIVYPEMLLPRRPERPLLLYDIAVPRNVDAGVGALDHVTLVDLDGLQQSAAVGERAAGVDAAWAIVEEAVEQYTIETRTRRAVPLIAALRDHVDRQRDVELARTLAGLSHLAPGDQEAVALMAHRLIDRMFHHLATRLKAAARLPDGDDYLTALSFLFEEVDKGGEWAQPPRDNHSRDGERGVRVGWTAEPARQVSPKRSAGGNPREKSSLHSPSPRLVDNEG